MKCHFLRRKFSFYNFIRSRLAPFVFLFFIAAVCGYLWEVILTYILNGILCNRGFLHGPWLPIYGFGAVLLLCLLKRFAKHPVRIFFLSALIGSFLELITGLALSVYWNLHYWDYSLLSWEIGGYVSLLSFFGFGIAGCLWICILSPRLLRVWQKIPSVFQNIFLYFFLILFFTDYLFSLFVPNGGIGVTF
jgi:uncharacterized membrane protein